MGWGAARNLWTVLDNTSIVIAVEVLCACEGIEQRRPLEPGSGTAAALRAVREHVAPLEDDRPPSADIEAIAALIENGTLQAAVESAIGPLE
jgi:histidine ammonia-lyase